MSRDDLFLLSLTFVTGVFLGAYVYVAAFKPVYESEDIGGGEVEASDFSVIGQTYGGYTVRGYIHPSFRLLGDGSYSLAPGGVGEEALEVIEDSLPKGLVSELKQEIEKADLEYLSGNALKETCGSYADDVNYKYTIVLEGETYRLDTCTTNLDFDDPLFQVLQDVWASLNGEATSGGYGSSGGFADWLSEQLYDRLHGGD